VLNLILDDGHDAGDGAVFSIKRRGVSVDGNLGQVRALAHGFKASNDFATWVVED
jgi:hypothetical protein